MKRLFSLARNFPWAGWALAALLVVAAGPGGAFGAERIVLGEQFTNLG